MAPIIQQRQDQTYENGVLVGSTPREVDVTAEVVEYTLHDLVRQAMVGMQAIIDSPQVTFTTLAQAQTQMRQLQAQVKDEARVLRRMLRLLLGDFTGTD